MAITIRPSEASDAAAIARVHVDSWRTTYPGIVPDDYLNSLLSYEQREEFWEELLTQGESTTFACVAEDTSGPVVGFASAGSERSGEAAYKGELYTIYILDSHQRQGIGRRLVCAAAERLVQRDLDSMLVWVLADNRPARSFYEALGGREVRQAPIEIGGILLTEVAYGWPDIRGLAEPGS